MRRAGRDYEDKQMTPVAAGPRPGSTGTEGPASPTRVPPEPPVTPPPTPPEPVPPEPDEPTDDELEDVEDQEEAGDEDAGQEQAPLTDTEARPA